jgi:hypothetical protein
VTRIIAIMGPAGSGKSTAAEYLVERYGAVRYSFARPLKELVRRAFDLTEAQVYGSQADKEAIDPRYGHSPRWLLQRIGTEGGRAVFGESFWTDQALNLIRDEGPALAVIDDCRFVSEARAVLARPRGEVWRLQCASGAQSSDAGTHASEREWRDAPTTADILVEYGVANLRAAIDEAYRGDADTVRSIWVGGQS